MTSQVFVDLSVLIIAAVVIIGIVRALKQPLIIGYIFTGLLFSPSLFNLIKSTELIASFSEIGVALLLFLVGLNLNPKIIKEVGFVSLVTGLGQVLFTSVIGFFIARALGFATIPSVYVAVALTFSSTIIIMKLLSDKEDLDKLYGKIAIGFLIVQDLIAVFALMAISSMSNQSVSFADFALKTFTTGAVAVIALFLIGFFVLPKITKHIAKSQEFLLLFSLGWCFAIATIFSYLNFSIEIGALLAGISLSISPYKIEISSKLKPLRDFFIFIFFIWLGSQMTFTNLSTQYLGIIGFSLFILIGNPLIVILLMSIMGYRKQNSFLAGLTVAQISEFSLILIALGVKVGHLSQDMLSFVTIIGIITIAGSSYMITYSNKIYPLFSGILSYIERKSSKKEKEMLSKKYDIILFGMHRTGQKILEEFKHKKSSILIVDYDPETIQRLTKKGYNCIYGDISDSDMLLELDICRAKMLISTVPDNESNSLFIRRAKMCNPDSIIIATAEQVADALELYKKGADYVILPHHLGGRYAAKLIKENHTSQNKYKKLKKEEIKELKKIISN